METLQAFFDAKYAFMKSIAESQQHPMDIMVKAVPDKYLNAFNIILNEVPGEYNIYTDNTDILLSDILQDGDGGIVFVPGHLQFVRRHSNGRYRVPSWRTYGMIDGEFTCILGELNQIEDSIFAHIDSPSKRKILACKILAK